MKKIRLTESQVSKLLNEDSYATIKRIYYDDIKKLKSGKGTLDGTTIRGIANALYDAIKGMGTDNDAITDNLNKCKNLYDFKNVRNKFWSMYNERLLTWLDDDIDGDGEWTTTVLRPLQRIYDVSMAAGHFKEVVQDATEKNIMSKFPCLGDTPGYKFDRAKDGMLYFKINNDDYVVKEDGTLMKHDGIKDWVPFPEKTRCVGAKYQDVSEQDINEQGIDLSPGVKKVEPEVKSTGTTNNTTTTGNLLKQTKTDTETKSTVAKAATATAGGSVSDFQQKLKDAGFGASLGAVDGKLGPKTARAAMEFIKSKGLLSETDELSLNEQISQNFKRFL